MYLKALYLQNFRLYEEARFDFSEKVNVIKGPNAKGKTTLLEAVYFLTTGHSFRTSQIKDLIRHGASGFYLDAIFVKHGIEQRLRAYYSPSERSVIYNSTRYPSLSSLLGILHSVVIHPDDSAIVKGAPIIRRNLLDMQLAQSDPLYIHHLTRYEKAMGQRNHLLRTKSMVTIDSWEYEMANSAAYVVQQRALAVSDLGLEGAKRYGSLGSGIEQFQLIYKANGAGDHPLQDLDFLRDLYKSQYRKHRVREMDLGATLTGPHKDDVVISLGGAEAKAFGSEGQQRSCVIAIRLAEWTRLAAASQEQPLMLIDDLGVSLDVGRRKHLLENFEQFDQVFVSTTDETELVQGEHAIVL
jgi:DNA replication and repair protein RecF